MLNGRFADSRPMAEEAVAVARLVDSPSDEALALGVLGWDLALLGRVDDGVARVREGIAIADALGGAEGIALGATNLAVLLDRVGRVDEALDVATTGWERARALGVERTYGGLLLAICAKAAIALGRWDEADIFLTTGLAHQPIGAPGIRLRIQRGRLDTFRGDLATAGEALAAARAADEAAGGTEDRAALLTALAELAAVTGDLGTVRAAVMEGFALAGEGMPDPALATLAATGLRVEADVAGRARTRRDEAELEDARRRTREIATGVERIASMLGVPDPSAEAPAEPSRQSALAPFVERRRAGSRSAMSPRNGRWSRRNSSTSGGHFRPPMRGSVPPPRPCATGAPAPRRRPRSPMRAQRPPGWARARSLPRSTCSRGRVASRSNPVRMPTHPKARRLGDSVSPNVNERSSD